MRKFAGRVAVIMALGGTASAQTPAVELVAPVTVPLATPGPTDMLIIKAGTMLLIQTSQPLSSKTSKPGDRFAISLASPLVEGQRAVLPAGIKGEGEIVHAAKARWGGKAGELIANARFLDCGAVRLPLGHLHWSSAGANKTGEAIAIGMAFSPAVFLISGGEVDIPVGTSGEAKLTSDIMIARADAANCNVGTVPPALTPPPPASTTGGTTK